MWTGQVPGNESHPMEKISQSIYSKLLELEKFLNNDTFRFNAHAYTHTHSTQCQPHYISVCASCLQLGAHGIYTYTFWLSSAGDVICTKLQHISCASENKLANGPDERAEVGRNCQDMPKTRNIWQSSQRHWRNQRYTRPDDGAGSKISKSLFTTTSAVDPAGHRDRLSR